jgi:hypothetical protein
VVDHCTYSDDDDADDENDENDVNDENNVNFGPTEVENDDADDETKRTTKVLDILYPNVGCVTQNSRKCEGSLYPT